MSANDETKRRRSHEASPCDSAFALCLSFPVYLIKNKPTRIKCKKPTTLIFNISAYFYVKFKII